MINRFIAMGVLGEPFGGDTMLKHWQQRNRGNSIVTVVSENPQDVEDEETGTQAHLQTRLIDPAAALSQPHRFLCWSGSECDAAYVFNKIINISLFISFGSVMALAGTGCLILGDGLSREHYQTLLPLSAASGALGHGVVYGFAKGARALYFAAHTSQETATAEDKWLELGFTLSFVFRAFLAMPIGTAALWTCGESVFTDNYSIEAQIGIAAGYGFIGYLICVWCPIVVFTAALNRGMGSTDFSYMP